MARPRSITGMVLHLGLLHARRRPALVLGALALTAGILATSGDDPAPAKVIEAPERQLAVLRDGFAVLDQRSPPRVIELDGEGALRRRVPLPLTTEARIAGTRAGIGVGWLDRGKLKLGMLESDGELVRIQTWGRSATMLCEGVASNDLRFGIGWLESDGRVWFVHGPVAPAVAARASTIANARPEVASTARPKPSWCGIASAYDYIALFWRAGNKTFFTMCSKKECSGIVAPLPLARGDELLGYGCLRDGCLLALRDDRGQAQLAWMTLTGRRGWTMPLPGATPATRVAITGAGDRALVVGYVTGEGATAARVIPAGSIVRVWADPTSTDAPDLAWARDRLLVAHRQAGAIATEIVPLPR